MKLNAKFRMILKIFQNLVLSLLSRAIDNGSCYYLMRFQSPFFHSYDAILEFRNPLASVDNTLLDLLDSSYPTQPHSF